ncbi:MAG: restriction endonuclease subunit S [Lachnospiraceae bacterium]|nr:restriction endonuclease subunit S [Lachnospiraceae bacterium]
MEYKKTTLGEISIGKGQYGIGASAVEYSPDLYTYLRITDINDDGTLNILDLKSVDDPKAREYLLSPNDIVFARTGNSTGRNYFYDGSDGEFVYAGFLIKFSLDPSKVNPRFIKYYCLSDEYTGWVQGYSTGSTRGNINAQTYAGMEILLPPREQQDNLVKILDDLEAKRKTNSAINRNLAEQVKGIFKEWFIDYGKFDGVMPDTWKELTLEDVSILSAGGDKPKNVSNVLTDEWQIPIFSNGISDEGLYGYTDHAKIFDESVTVSARGTIGYVCLRQEPYVPIVRLVSLIPKNEFVTAKYLYLWLESIHIMGTGTTQQQLTVPDFKKTRIIVPNKEIVTQFTETVIPLFDELLKNKKQSVKLAELRNSLLPKLLSGELDVSEFAI